MNYEMSISHSRNLYNIHKKGENKIYGLDHVGFELHKDEMVAVMGASSSGKSTVLNVLGALDEIAIYRKELKNYQVKSAKYQSHDMELIYQDVNLLKDLSVQDNLALPLILRNVCNKVVIQKVEEYIHLVGLDGCQKHRPVELSGGQQQRLAIAMALITSPPVLLADEPTANLDYHTSIEILDMLLKLKETMNQSMIILTHDPKVAVYADRVIFLDDDKVIDQYRKSEVRGDIDEIVDDHYHREFLS